MTTNKEWNALAELVEAYEIIEYKGAELELAKHYGMDALTKTYPQPTAEKREALSKLIAKLVKENILDAKKVKEIIEG